MPQKPNFHDTLKISIQPSKLKFAKNELVCIDVTFHNTGSTEQDFDSYWRIPPRIKARIPGFQADLPKTNFARNEEEMEDWYYSHSQKEWGIANPIFIEMKPGEKRNRRYEVNDWSDLTAAGKLGERPIYVTFERFGISSNAVLIQIDLPARAAPPFLMNKL